MVLNDAGEISNVRLERFALFLLDGAAPVRGWEFTGGTNSGGSMQYRKSAENDPLFVARVEALRAEREELMRDPVFGLAEMAAVTQWRDARCRDDAKGAEKAMEALMKLAL
ncbi:MAG: hypothetical protein KKA05_10255, partial [Alphaproteobacteria bacterium]|nr:hypothetical protein [Alphaproteobacteria bacterium]